MPFLNLIGDARFGDHVGLSRKETPKISTMRRVTKFSAKPNPVRTDDRWQTSTTIGKEEPHPPINCNVKWRWKSSICAVPKIGGCPKSMISNTKRKESNFGWLGGLTAMREIYKYHHISSNIMCAESDEITWNNNLFGETPSYGPNLPASPRWVAW